MNRPLASLHGAASTGAALADRLKARTAAVMIARRMAASST
jgi:predicted dinucleotide-binding enzyme